MAGPVAAGRPRRLVHQWSGGRGALVGSSGAAAGMPSLLSWIEAAGRERSPASQDSDPRCGRMPYWSIDCLYCRGYIADALLECVPASKRSTSSYRRLFQARAGAALACPYCNGLQGFDDSGRPQAPQPGSPVFRYGRAELEVKKEADGEGPSTPLTDWASRHRFTQPGTHAPFSGYTYAEHAPPDETVP